jgi:hypothetical protein
MIWLAIPIIALSLVSWALWYQKWRDWELVSRPSIAGFLVFQLDMLMSIVGGVTLVVALDIAGFRSEDRPYGASAVCWAIFSGICMVAVGGFIGVKLLLQRDLRRKFTWYLCVLGMIALSIARIHFDRQTNGA